MSNDLISRSALLEEINNFSMRITGSTNAMAITIMEETKNSVSRMIDEQPTAYDTDKVVEQLEKRYMEMVDGKCKLSISNFFEYAVDLVKSGGVE